MKNQRIRITLTLMVLGILCLLVATAIANETKEENYAFGIKPEKMQVVNFNEGDPLHDFHVEVLEGMGKDCTVCHTDEENYTFMNMAKMHNADQDTLTAYVHKTCVACHVELSAGPKITSCRGCHFDSLAAVAE